MKFLIVDDEYLALNRLKALLKPYGECDAAVHANQACEMFQTSVARKKLYDLMTIDIDMPDTPGTELLLLIREIERKTGVQRTKIIMVSASGSPRNVRLAIENECDDFIVKPVQKEILHKKLQTLGLAEPTPLPNSVAG